MADENISIKIGLDTTNFNNSIKGMTAELKALSKVDISLLSEKDAKAVISRMGDLKNSIGDIKKEINNADPDGFFNSFTTLASPAIAAVGGLSIAMSMFGTESKKVEEIQRNLMGIITILSSLQSIADAKKLKGIAQQIPLQYQSIKAGLQEILMIKASTVATVTDTAAKETQGAAVVKLTMLQKLWNMAVAANPIMLLVVGITALVGAVYGLSKAFSDNSEKIDESERSLNGYIIKNKELRDLTDKLWVEANLQELDILNVEGGIGDYETMVRKQRIIREQAIKQSADEVDKVLKDLESKWFGAELDPERRTWLDQFVGVDRMNTIIESAKYGSKKLMDVLSQTDIAYLDAKEIANKKIDEIDLKAQKEHDDMFKQLQNETNRLMEENVMGGIKSEEDRLNKQFEWDKEHYKKKFDNVETYDEFLQVLERNHAMKLEEIHKRNYDNLLKLHTDYYNTLLKNANISQDKLDEINSPSTEKEKLDAKYNNDFNALIEYYSKNKLEYKWLVDSLEQLDKEYRNNKEALDLTTDRNNYKKRLELQRTYLKQSIEDQRKAELKQMMTDATAAGSSPKQIAEYRAAINKKYDDQIFEYRKSLQLTTDEQEIQMEIDKLDRMLLTNEEYEAAKQKIRNKYNKNYIDSVQIQINTENQMKEIQTQMLTTLFSGMLSIMQENNAIYYQNELDKVQKSYEYKYKAIDDEVKYGIISQAEADKKKEELDKQKAAKEKSIKIKQFKSEQSLALAQIAINTAMAVVKVMSQVGIVASTIIPWVLGLGALEAGLVMARPMPQFKTGSMTPFQADSQGSPALLHSGEMVLNAKAVKRLGANNIRDINLGYTGGSVSYGQVAELISMSLDKYSQIPVVVKEYDITTTQDFVRNVRVNSEVQ